MANTNTGYLIRPRLKKVSNDGNNYPLDVNNVRTSISGLPQDTMANDTTAANYKTIDYTSCPLNVTVYSSIAYSASYTRTNCGDGYTAGSVTYVVPQGKYTSTVSQTAANTLASNDLVQNGPAYANANAVCTPLTGVVNYSNNPDHAPYVDGGVIMYVDGVEITRTNGIITGTVPAYTGQVITIVSYHFPTNFPPPPNSTATLRVLANSAEVYNTTVSANITATEETRYSFTFIGGKASTYYQVYNTTSSIAVGYRTDGLRTNDYTTQTSGGYQVSAFDNTTSQSVLNVYNVLPGLTHDYTYNTLKDSTTQNIYVKNNDHASITVTVTTTAGVVLGTIVVAVGASNSMNIVKGGVYVNIRPT